MKRFTIALAASVFALPALAADLGGNCCADLEERVAELEATTARKDGRKVSLTISGQVSKALLWHDIDGLNGTDRGRVIDNASSPSVLRFAGSAKLNASVSAGFIYEFGIDPSRGKGLGQEMDDIYLRHAAVWLSTSAGKLTLGQTSTATDGIAEITVANTVVASRMLSLDPLWTYAGSPTMPISGRSLDPLAFDGGRTELVRYDTPTFAGFTASASFAPGASLTGEDIWDVALRYSGEHAGVRVAGGIGYRSDKNGMISIPGPSVPAMTTKTAVGSASVMHMATGLFLNLSAAHQTDNLLYGDVKAFHAQGGIERNWFGIGATTLFLGFGDHRIKDGDDSKLYEAGVVQAIDGLGADLFLTGRMYDVDGEEVKAVIGGMRIKF